MSKPNAKQALDELKTHLDTTTSESSIQAFLENNPYLVTGAKTVFADVVISQLPLGAEFRVDFAYIESRSIGNYLNLIEIEKPGLLMFSEADEFTQPYNHAFQQLQDWAHWCTANRDYLRNVLQPLLNRHSTSSDFGLHTKCWLIAGRRAELTSTRRQRRYSAKGNELPRNIQIMTYDAFLESLGLTKSIDPEQLDRIHCVTYKNQNFFEKEIAKISP